MLQRLKRILIVKGKLPTTSARRLKQKTKNTKTCYLNQFRSSNDNNEVISLTIIMMTLEHNQVLNRQTF